ncbi:MAG: hypothetical protein JRH20_30450, partial [Deltaproteobacteria bacterium]|nr:hypothetical protein [Deltaproteobacteria bacterium]
AALAETRPPDGAVSPPEHLWSKTMGDISDDQGTRVVVDASGNITLMATFAGTIDPGGGEITSDSTFRDLFVTSFTSEGVHRWQRVLNGPGGRRWQHHPYGHLL